MAAPQVHQALAGKVVARAEAVAEDPQYEKLSQREATAEVPAPQAEEVPAE